MSQERHGRSREVYIYLFFLAKMVVHVYINKMVKLLVGWWEKVF